MLKSIVEILMLLVKLYHSEEIDYITFKNNVELKISFLKENLNMICTTHDKKCAAKIIKECELILAHSSLYKPN